MFSNKQAFITLKDYKDNFENNPKYRLLNPAKSEIGIISKHHLQRINDKLRDAMAQHFRCYKMVPYYH